jgi:flagellar basal-body rod modification protein FlgD
MSLVTGNAIDPKAGSTVAQSLAIRHAAAATTVGTAAQQGISSNDFLTLLVTEMKNQDPTQPTDPNAYIQQLVGVNSLQQLISINQDLSGAGTTAPPTATGGVAAPGPIGS